MASTGRTSPLRLPPARQGAVMRHVPPADQLAEKVGPVTLINIFKVAPRHRRPPGRVGRRCHLPEDQARVHLPSAAAASPAAACLVNHAAWESVQASRNAFGDPQLQASFARSPDSTVAAPHLFQKVAVPASAWTASWSTQQRSTWPRSGRVVHLAAGVRRGPGHRGPESIGVAGDLSAADGPRPMRVARRTWCGHALSTVCG